MQIYWTLVRRELGGYFNSLLGYVIIASAAFLMGLSFVVLLGNLRSEPMPVTLTELFFMTPFFWMIVLLAAPVITMRSFAMERFSGTYETLMTTPVRDVQVVMAKFTAALVFYIILWLPLLACLFIVRHYTDQQGALDAGVLGSTYLGIILIGSVFLAMGCLGSALTRSQTVAAMIGLGLGTALFMASFMTDQFQALAPVPRELLAGFSLVDQMRDFTRGVLDTRPVVFHLSLTFIFLFFTVRAIESRRWK
ncbi:MAG: ABC transporter permease subunit [Verrucomicrobia bacterium]|jgi:ABC-2 type transport system permease protein|nr:ABC transporter permease subunit [Verrucomicrobiota bacterium]